MTVVGVTLRPFSGADFPEKLALNRAYFEALDAAGATVMPIPVIRDLDHLHSLYERLDALLLPGGADVEPRRYAAEPRDDCHLTLMPELDEVELSLARWAVEDDLPVLAICRGIQLLNVACGGTLWQDLIVEGVTKQHHDQTKRDLLAHDLEIEAAPVFRTEPLERLQRVVHQNDREARRQLGGKLFDDRAGGAAFRRLGDEAVAVEFLAAQSEEQIARLERP